MGKSFVGIPSQPCIRCHACVGWILRPNWRRRVNPFSAREAITGGTVGRPSGLGVFKTRALGDGALMRGQEGGL